MKNCLRKWFRHLLLISITSVGAAAASPARAHDLPIFDSCGLYTCFGLSSPTWQVNPNIPSFADQYPSAAEPTVDWTNSGWSWCFADSPSLEKVQTEDRKEFVYLGPATSQSNQIAKIPFSNLSKNLAPFNEDFAAFDSKLGIQHSAEADQNDEFQGCQEEQFDCFPAKRYVSQPSYSASRSTGSMDRAYYDEGCPDEFEDNSDAIDSNDSSDQAETLVNEDYVKSLSDLPDQEIPSFSSLLQAGYNMLPKFSLSDAYAGLRNWVLSDVKPIVRALEPTELAKVPEVNSPSSFSSSNGPNYLRNRTLVDDYLDGESFVRDWRNLRLFHNPTPAEPAGMIAEYSWNAPIHDEIARAEPLDKKSLSASETLISVATAIENLQCYWAQELHSFDRSRAVGRTLASGILSLKRQAANLIATWSDQLQGLNRSPVADTHDLEVLGQPLFVIHQLDGKEFLLPAKQARHWNTVPQLPPPKPIDWQSIVAKSAAIGSLAVRYDKPNYVEQAAGKLSFVFHNGQPSDVRPSKVTSPSTGSFSQLSRNLIRSSSVGLDSFADRIHGLARTIRLVLDANAQVAELSDGESVR